MILAAGLTPAWQRILVFDRLRLGEVNRAVEASACASGKVLNVARACCALGVKATALTVVGGSAGEAIRQEFERDSLPADWISSPRPTRVCTTLIDPEGGVTELVENSLPLDHGELERFRSRYLEAAGAAETVVLSGSLPPQTPTEFYRELIETTPGRVILDARGPELRAALAARPYLVKPNRQELEATVGRALETDESVVAALRELNRQGATWALVTQGAGAVWATSLTETLRFDPPALTAVRNPIGCGDCLAAGIAVGLQCSEELAEAVRLGLAAAAENALELLPARLERAAVDARRRGIVSPVRPVSG